MRVISVITLLATLVLPTATFAEVQTFTATHTYSLGDHDSKDDARQRCLLEVKRKILEQAGVYIESASEVRNFDLTKDKITSFAAAVMQVKNTKESFGFENEHMTMTLKLTAQLDLEEVRKQLAARQVDASMRDDVAAQKERLKRLEALFEAMMQRQQGGQSPGQLPAFPPIDFSAEEVQTWAARGNVDAQYILGTMYNFGDGAPQDYTKAQQWLEKAAAQGDARAQFALGAMYDRGQGVPKDYFMARKWFEQAAAQGDADAQGALGRIYESGNGVPQNYRQAAKWYEQAAVQGNMWAQFDLGWLYANGQGVPQDDVRAAKWVEKSAAQGYAKAQHFLGMMYALGAGVPKDHVRAYMWSNVAAAHLKDALQPQAVEYQDKVARHMTPSQILEAQRLAQQCQARQFKGC